MTDPTGREPRPHHLTGAPQPTATDPYATQRAAAKKAVAEAQALADIPKWDPKVVPDSAALKQANTAAEQAKAAANQSRTVASRTSREVDDAKRANDQARKAAENKKPDGCRTNSFVPGTGVVMADGSVKAIDDVAVGDTVVAVAADGSRTHRQVVATITGHGAKDLVGLTLVGSGAGGPPADETITATDGHLFLTADGAWVPARDLQVGDQLVDPDGTPVVIAAIDDDTVVATVHNLTVDVDHTYSVVTDAGIDVVTHDEDPRHEGLRDAVGDAAECRRAAPDSDYSLNRTTERAGDLDKYTESQSTRDPFSHYEFMDDDEFLATINGVEEGAGINVSQGGSIIDVHHRWDELRRRVAAGRISPDTMIDVWRLGR
ncbi:polymorphic toxin-type HINT domain-containing protein [Cellulomonas flavigena]|nr:polymorphic toxin-type HINT domain-containing protein [Cellulomonas flavigena]